MRGPWRRRSTSTWHYRHRDMPHLSIRRQQVVTSPSLPNTSGSTAGAPIGRLIIAAILEAYAGFMSRERIDGCCRDCPRLSSIPETASPVNRDCDRRTPSHQQRRLNFTPPRVTDIPADRLELSGCPSQPSRSSAKGPRLRQSAAGASVVVAGRRSQVVVVVVAGRVLLPPPHPAIRRAVAATAHSPYFLKFVILFS